MTVDTKNVLNIAAYKFVPLSGLEQLRKDLIERMELLQLKGTVLLSPEGINMFLAGEVPAIRDFIEFVRGFEAFGDLEVKESYSDRQPFNRTLVRLKKEIIAFGIEGVDPIGRATPKLEATKLRDWLREGRELTLLDVRNDYEVELGTFHGAKAIGVDHFREFPAAVKELPEDLKEKPVVMFCTGGIRCEKAGPFMEREGFGEVYQLDGGILKYFETVGGEHYDGDCFVFDQRVSVDPSLSETDTDLCYVCQATLSIEDQQSPQYQPGVHCPHCYCDPDEQLRQRLQLRDAAIASYTDPLPGSVPQDNVRPIVVSQKCEGMVLIDLLDRAHPHVGREQWRRRCQNGLLRLQDEPVDENRVVHTGERYQHLIRNDIEPDVNASIQIIYEDDAIVVANKPAPLPMHPSGRFNRNSLTSILNQVYKQPLRIAHRLDANTTGIVVLSRSKAVARVVQPQFESGSISKTYLALVMGHPTVDHFSCDARISSEPVQAGLRTISPDGLDAETQFSVLQRFDDGTCLLKVRPLTGRTNQIRLHLWSLGLPIKGDPAYLEGKRLGNTQTLPVGAPPMCLHAWKLSFMRYGDEQAVDMIAPSPAWAGSASDDEAKRAD